MSFVAGIDYSSHAIHVVLLDTDTDAARWHERRIDIGPGGSFDRARRIRDAMPARGMWRDSGVVLVGIEATLSRQRNAIAALSRVQGAILACLPFELAVVPLPAQEWKRVTVGKAKASKEQVAVWASERWDPVEPVKVQDCFDAYCIAWATRSLCEEAAAA